MSTMNDEIMSGKICRGCMKVGGIFLSMYSDAMCDKNLPDKLSSLASISIDKHDGLPNVLCPKCAYRTDAFYNFKLQVQESEKQLRKLFKNSMDKFSNDSTHNVVKEEKFIDTDCQSNGCDYTDASEVGIENHLNNVLVNMEYTSENMDESLNGKIKIESLSENNNKNDQFLMPPPAKFNIKSKPIRIVKNRVSKKFNDETDSSATEYMLFYVPPDDTEIDIKDETNNEQSSSIIKVSNVRTIGTKKKQEELHNDDGDAEESKNNFEVSDCDSDDYIDPKDNLLGSLNDTIVKIKEVKLENGSLQHQCTLCMQNYSELKDVLSHTVDNHIPSTGPFYCVVCEKDCDSHKELRAHIKVHTGPNPYACFICDKAYSMKRYLKRHMTCHTDFPRHRCSKCGKRFSVKKELENHLATHLHGVPYSCSQCSRRFNHKANYKRHLISHLDPCGVRLPKYPCGTCGKRFQNNRTLQTHMRVHTGEKPYKCDVCGRSFSQQGNLLNHARIHSNPRSYTCEVCGKRFNQRATLRDHTLLHTGEKPYVCNICGIAFTFSAALRRHMWTHASDKPYGCDVCNAKFVGRYDLNRHMKIHNNRIKVTRKKNQSQSSKNNADNDGEHNNDISISIESSNQDHEQNNIVVTQVTPVTEQTIFIEHVLVDQDGIQIIVPQEDSEKENVDALFNLIQYD